MTYSYGYDRDKDMKFFKGECKWHDIISIILIIILPFLGIYLDRKLIRAKQTQPKEKVEIIADSRKINDKYETQALVTIENIGLTGEKDFRFQIEVNRSSEIVYFDSENLISEVEEKSKSYSRTYTAALPGEGKIEGTLTFISYIGYKRGETAVPIKIRCDYAPLKRGVKK